MTAWLYWHSRSLTSVLCRARVLGALAEEPETPDHERGIQARAHADGGLVAQEGAEEHPGGLRRGPREGVAGRDDARVARARIPSDAVLLLEERDLVPLLRQVVGGRDARNAAAEHECPHERILRPRGYGAALVARKAGAAPGRSENPAEEPRVGHDEAVLVDLDLAGEVRVHRLVAVAPPGLETGVALAVDRDLRAPGTARRRLGWSRPARPPGRGGGLGVCS